MELILLIQPGRREFLPSSLPFSELFRLGACGRFGCSFEAPFCGCPGLVILPPAVVSSLLACDIEGGVTCAGEGVLGLLSDEVTLLIDGLPLLGLSLAFGDFSTFPFDVVR